MLNDKGEKTHGPFKILRMCEEEEVVHPEVDEKWTGLSVLYYPALQRYNNKR